MATDTCGQVRPAKLSITTCEYWICLENTVMGRGAGIGIGGLTRKVGTTCPGSVLSALSVRGGSPGWKIGTMMVCSTVSIQKVADICNVCAFSTGFWGAVRAEALPSKNAMLSVPPPNRGELGFVEIDMTVVSVILCPLIALRSTMFGFCNMLCQVASVRPPAPAVRFCGILGVSPLAAV